jgi:transporter family protein
MFPVWIPFITLTILLFGFGQVFTKTGVSRLGLPRMLLLLSINMMIFYGGAYILFHEDTAVPLKGIAWGVLATFLASIGYIFYYEAVNRERISIVGVITAAYPFITVILAMIFLQEPLTLFQFLAILLIIVSVSLLSYTPSRNRMIHRQSNLWLLYALISIVIWGVQAVIAKASITLIGHFTYVGIYAVVGPATLIPYWYIKEGSWSFSWKDVQAELSVSFFCLGGIFLYMALNYGLVSIVTAFSNLYPFITLLVARLLLSEHLENHHWIAVTSALIGIVLLMK